MTISTVWGYVTADGKQESGAGYSIEHDSKNAPGVYYIRFDKGFTSVPAVNVTIVN